MYYTKKIPAVSQNGSKEVTIAFEGEFNCLRDKTEKYKIFVLIKMKKKKKIQKLDLKNYNLL